MSPSVARPGNAADAHRVRRSIAEAAASVRHDDLKDLSGVSPDLTAAALRAKLLAVVRKDLGGRGRDLEARLIPPPPPKTG